MQQNGQVLMILEWGLVYSVLKIIQGDPLVSYWTVNKLQGLSCRQRKRFSNIQYWYSKWIWSFAPSVWNAKRWVGKTALFFPVGYGTQSSAVASDLSFPVAPEATAKRQMEIALMPQRAGIQLVGNRRRLKRREGQELGSEWLVCRYIFLQIPIISPHSPFLGPSLFLNASLSLVPVHAIHLYFIVWPVPRQRGTQRATCTGGGHKKKKKTR